MFPPPSFQVESVCVLSNIKYCDIQDLFQFKIGYGFIRNNLLLYSSAIESVSNVFNI